MKSCLPIKAGLQLASTLAIFLGLILLLGLACTSSILTPITQSTQPTFITEPSIASHTPDLQASLDSHMAALAERQVTMDAINQTQTVSAASTILTIPSSATLQNNYALPGFSQLTDLFNDPNSGWPEQKQGPDQWWYAMDHYHIQVGTANNQVVIPSGFSMADGTVVTSGLILDQTHAPQAFFGVVCRYQDADNFYFFEISPDGFYRIGKIWNGVISLLGMNTTQASPLIQSTEEYQYKELAAVCRGDQLSLFVNDQLVQTVTDDSLSYGEAGLCANAGQISGIIAAFEYFIAEE